MSLKMMLPAEGGEHFSRKMHRIRKKVLIAEKALKDSRRLVQNARGQV